MCLVARVVDMIKDSVTEGQAWGWSRKHGAGARKFKRVQAVSKSFNKCILIESTGWETIEKVDSWWENLVKVVLSAVQARICCGWSKCLNTDRMYFCLFSLCLSSTDL